MFLCGSYWIVSSVLPVFQSPSQSPVYNYSAGFSIANSNIYDFSLITIFQKILQPQEIYSNWNRSKTEGRTDLVCATLKDVFIFYVPKLFKYFYALLFIFFFLQAQSNHDCCRAIPLPFRKLPSCHSDTGRKDSFRIIYNS